LKLKINYDLKRRFTNCHCFDRPVTYLTRSKCYIFVRIRQVAALGVEVSSVLSLHKGFPINRVPKVGLMQGSNSDGTGPDDLSREIFGVLGLPVDSLDLPGVLQKIGAAAADASPLLISTPNVNFLIASRSNTQFRESLLLSDLCLPDGMPIVWIARLLGIPIKKRISGADLFEALKSEVNGAAPLKVFLFGGADGAAETVCKNLNSQAGGLRCVGVLNPGFGTLDEIGSQEIIETINSSTADLLAVFFGARKAQGWLLLNRQRLTVPIRAQFGATINFQAGLTKRAPKLFQEAGLEWLWRIKEEPYLWRRYWDDGLKLLWLVLTSALPLWISARWMHLRGMSNADPLIVEVKEDNRSVTVNLSGFLTAQYVDRAIPYFRGALGTDKQIIVDLSKARGVDPRFFGLFLVLYKATFGQSRRLQFAGVAPKMARTFSRNGFDFLLSGEP
jgi:N-acetylglucosaminyldiphosphoundecaprenol N-acetyl-beta-D-mannosaminyltransferase